MLSSVLQFGDSRCGKPAKRRQRRGLRLGLDSSLAFLARERFSKVRGATRLGYHPRADGPRGIVADVLSVAALEVGDPVAEVVLVKSYDLALRREWTWHFDSAR